jgi:hypothetical protein
MQARNGTKMPRWSKAEVDALRRLHKRGMPHREIAFILSRTMASVNGKISQCCHLWEHCKTKQT